jgi:RNA polymerase sigma-70 factor (ECF subfamily)
LAAAGLSQAKKSRHASAMMRSSDAKHVSRELDEFRAALAHILPRLRRFARALTQSEVEAEEIVQAACLRALDKREQFTSGRFDTWMFQITRNIWIDQGRASKVRAAEPLDTVDQVVGSPGEEQALRRIELAQVRRTLDELPPPLRCVLVLVCADGLSYKETAEILGIPVGTVMSRLHRARLELHRRLSGP